MVVVLAIGAAVVLLAVFARPTRHLQPPRIVPGATVVGPDGVVGLILRTEGTWALVQIGDARAAWMRGQALLGAAGPIDFPPMDAADAAGPPPAVTFTEGRLATLGRAVARRGWAVVALWVVLVAISVPLAVGIPGVLEAGGFLVRGGETAGVIDRVGTEFDRPRAQIAVILPGPVKPTTARIDELRPALMHIDNVREVGTPTVSKDGSLLSVPISFHAVEQESIETLWAVRDLLHDTGGFAMKDIRIAGTTATAADTTEQAKRDLAKAEMFGIPAAILVLLFVFRTLVAALVPIVIGGVSVVVSLAMLRLVAQDVDLSIFVMNIATLLGLGLGIDYSLLGVSRFRSELARGATTADAVVTVVASSGRASLVSGLAVAGGMAALGVIPLGVMTSIAIGGVVVVAVAVFASLTLLPAMLALLGPRIERLAVPGRRTDVGGDETATRWYAMVAAVMRRPGLSLALSSAVLVLMVLPATRVHIEIPHDEVLVHSPSRDAAELYHRAFDQRVVAPIVVIADTADPAVVGALVDELVILPHIVEANVVTTSKEHGTTLVHLIGDDEIARGGATARALVLDIRAMDLPADIEVGGVASGEQEFLGTLRDSAPVTVAIVFLLTLVILGFAFRSIILPLKAIMLATLSIAAAFGIVTLVFQDGVGAGVLGMSQMGYVDATLPIVMFCILFSLSMDYEVFLLARITELYQAGHDDATQRGVSSTAPLITGAALILVVIGASFALTDLVLVQEIGFGMAVALLIDATIVRFVLLPAAMQLLGERNWWMPRWLALRIPRLEWSH